MPTDVLKMELSGRNKLTLRDNLKKNSMFLLMIAPALIYFFIFNYLPMSGLILAFERYNHPDGILSPWIGFANFNFLFVSGAIARVTFNTIFYNLIFLFTCQFIALAVAIVLSEIRNKTFKKIFHSLMFLPYFISFVVVGAIVYNIFTYEFGLLNTILKSLHKEPLNVYGMPHAWIIILTFLNTWKWVGYTSIIYLAGTANIDPEIYEAAQIDGANIWARIRYIVFPALLPLMITIMLFQLGSILRGQFELFYNVIGNNSNLFEATDVIDTYVFRMLVFNFDIGMGTAAGLFQSVFGLALILIVNYFIKKYRKDYALF
jgi:putative aldouronate transport system permease protein